MKFRDLINEGLNLNNITKEIVKELRGPDWGITPAGGNGEIKNIKGNTFQIYESFWVSDKRKEESIKKEWGHTGAYGKYFKEEYGVTIEVINFGKEETTKGSWYVTTIKVSE